MKKDGLVLFAIILSVLMINLGFVLAADTQDPKVKKAYECLENKVKDKCNVISLEEEAFSLLAIGKCSSELQSKSKDSECWPSSGCKLRDTALAVWALDNTGKPTDKAETWLLKQKKNPKELIWYLEIESGGETNCKIGYSGAEKEIKISEDKKINRGAGACLSLAQDSYWLKVDEDCYETNFTISCDKDFKTTLLYSKKNSPTVYVSSKTNQASSGGRTEEKVNAFCFGTGKDCDYEGSLWATFALAKTEHDVRQFLPYLIAMAEDNEKFFPSAFLYMITDYEEYVIKIMDEQKDDYWKISNSQYHQFYDTALALLALRGLEQAEPTKTYLLGVQDTNGCWNDNLRDTAFILFAGWPKVVSVGGGGGGLDTCQDHSHFCVSPLKCEAALDNFVCLGGGGEVCCEEEAAEEKCSDKKGRKCDEGYECNGDIVPTEDIDECCVGDCEKIEKTACEKENYECKSSCDEETEETKEFACKTEEEFCCATKASPPPSYWWIWLLIILIILVVIAIFFRNQLRIWLFRIKSGFKRGPAPTAMRPGPGPRFQFPPAPSAPMPMARPRMFLPRQPMPPTRQPTPPPNRPPMRPAPSPQQTARKEMSPKDKELEETLKKLKEMSK